MRFKVILLFFLVCMIGFPVFGDRPKDIAISPDFEKDQLEIKIANFVRNPAKRYIRKIEMIVNGREPLKKYFSFQKKGFYKILVIDIADLGEAANVTIRAYRDRGGFLEKKFNIQEFKK